MLPWEPGVWALADISKLSLPQSDGNSLWGTCLAESPQADRSVVGCCLLHGKKATEIGVSQETERLLGQGKPCPPGDLGPSQARVPTEREPQPH